MLALWGIHGQSLASTESTAKLLCRVYLGIGLGLLQPLFLLTALLLAQHSLGYAVHLNLGRRPCIRSFTSVCCRQPYYWKMRLSANGWWSWLASLVVYQCLD